MGENANFRKYACGLPVGITHSFVAVRPASAISTINDIFVRYRRNSLSLVNFIVKYMVLLRVNEKKTLITVANRDVVF